MLASNLRYQTETEVKTLKEDTKVETAIALKWFRHL
jgi:hypothetical protein